jgi:disulfide bond formation protein DsbB
MGVADIVVLLLPYLVLATQIALVLVFLFWLATKIWKRPFRSAFLDRHRNLLSLVVAATATLGSIFFSKVLGYVPCELCWYQRICMYPLAAILAVATWKRKDAFAFIAPLLLIGAAFSVYHYNVQFFNVPTFCKAGEVSCALKGNVAFGYITTPLMALTAFAAIFALQALGRGKRKVSEKSRRKRR